MATHNTPQLVRFQEEHPVARDSKGLREDGGCPTGAGIIAKLTPRLALIGTLTLLVDRAVLYNLVKSHRDSSFENLERKSGRGPLGDSAGLVMF